MPAWPKREQVPGTKRCGAAEANDAAARVLPRGQFSIKWGDCGRQSAGGGGSPDAQASHEPAQRCEVAHGRPQSDYCIE